MARKQQNRVFRRTHRRQAIMSIVRAYLDLDTVEQYQDWCFRHGFSTNLNKSPNDVMLEYGRYKQRQALDALSRFAAKQRSKTIIRKLFSKELDYYQLNGDVQRAIYGGFNNTKNADLLRDTYLHLAEHSKIMESAACVRAIANAVNYSNRFIRNIFSWNMKGKNALKQTRSLLRHLFCQYDVPVFMDEAWFDGSEVHIGWYLHVGQGNNIRTARNLPITLTSKMAHYFVQAPENYPIAGALRRAQMIALGSDEEMASAVAKTRLGREFVGNEFWLTVMQFFVNYPRLDYIHYGPIVDYIFNQRYENRAGVDLDADCDVGGEQPNFSMKGRTPESMLRLVNEWHQQLSNVTLTEYKAWKPRNMVGLHYVEKGDKLADNRTWIVRELTSNRELYIEGDTQNHCVASYVDDCMRGYSSIWTMEVVKDSKKVKLLTIEVVNDTRQIVQIRGRHNREVQAHELTILKRWAAKAKLTIAYDDVYD